jgi:hypothetical protein
VRRSRERTDGRGPSSLAEQARVFIEQIAVGHPREIIADGSVQTIRRQTAQRRRAEQARFFEVSCEHRAEHPATALIHLGDTGMIIEIRVEKLPQLAICRA